MRLENAAAVGVVTAWWIAADLVLLFDPYLADGIATYLGVSPAALEFGVLAVGCLASWGAHKAAELGD